MLKVSFRAGDLAAALTLAALLGCTGTTSPRRPAPPPAAKAVTAEQRTVIDREYFMAVSAYARGDYAEALLILKKILSVDPANPDALSLRRRISAAQKAGGS